MAPIGVAVAVGEEVGESVSVGPANEVAPGEAEGCEATRPALGLGDAPGDPPAASPTEIATVTARSATTVMTGSRFTAANCASRAATSPPPDSRRERSERLHSSQPGEAGKADPSSGARGLTGP
jgi:hypothetical protein